MNWLHFGRTVLVGGLATSLSDWLFMGVLFHEKYKAHPEVWRRPEGGAGETRAILWSTLLGFSTCAVFAYVCARLGFMSYHTTLKLAVAIWAMAPLPLIVINSLWMKLHPLIAFSYALGWLVKLLVTAVAVSWLLD